MAGAVFQWDAGPVATKATAKYSGKYSSVNQTDDKCSPISAVVNENPPYVNPKSHLVIGADVARAVFRFANCQAFLDGSLMAECSRRHPADRIYLFDIYKKKLPGKGTIHMICSSVSRGLRVGGAV